MMSEEMIQVKYIGDGKHYAGFDNGSSITIVKGGTAKVSQEKLKQLLLDYPKDFEVVEKGKGK